MAKIPVTNQRLLELSRNENLLIKLYEDIRYNRFRSDFIQANKERVKSVNDKSWKITKEFFVIEEDKVKFEPTPPIPKVPAVYKTEVVREKSFWKKEITKQVLISEEIPEKKQPDHPVLLEDKTMEEFNKANKAFCEEQTIMEV